MKFTIKKEEINKLCLVAAMAKKRDESIIHILANADEGNLKISVYLESELFLETYIPANVSESGECNVKAFRLKAALHQYPDFCCVCLKNGHIRICADDNSCNVQSKVEISTVAIPFNPLTFNISDCYINVKVASSDLTNLLTDVKSSYISLPDASQPILELTRLKFENDFIQADSVDIGRITRSKLQLKNAAYSKSNVNITNKLAKRIVDTIRVFKIPDDNEISIFANTKLIQIHIGDIVLINKKILVNENDLITGSGVHNIFSTENRPFSATVDIAEFKKFCIEAQIVSVEQGEIMTRDPVCIMKREGNPFLVCKYETTDGNVYREIPIVTSSENTLDSFSFYVNLKAFFSGISRFDGTVNIFVNSSSSLFLMTAVAQTDNGLTLCQSQLFSLINKKYF